MSDTPLRLKKGEIRRGYARIKQFLVQSYEHFHPRNSFARPLITALLAPYENVLFRIFSLI